MSRRTCHFRGEVCRGYPTPTQSIAVSHVIMETGRPRGRGTEKENNNNKAVGQVFVLTLSVFFERTRANSFLEPEQLVSRILCSWWKGHDITLFRLHELETKRSPNLHMMGQWSREVVTVLVSSFLGLRLTFQTAFA